MKSKTKLTVLISLVGVLVLLSGVYFIKGTSSTEKTVKIVDIKGSICTQDVPSSSCGPAEVIAQTANGQNITYQIPGFENRNSKHYDEITSKIYTAKEQNTQVTLKVNDKDEIISIK